MSVAKATDADFESALGSSRKTVVKFYTEWCGSCQLISPLFFQLSKKPEYQELQFLEVNSEENPISRRRAMASHLPFIATFCDTTLHQSGVLHWTSEGGGSTKELMERLISNLLEKK